MYQQAFGKYQPLKMYIAVDAELKAVSHHTDEKPSDAEEVEINSGLFAGEEKIPDERLAVDGGDKIQEKGPPQAVVPPESEPKDGDWTISDPRSARQTRRWTRK